MARRILALDLGSHSLKAAVVESSLRGCAVRGLFAQPREAARPLAEQVLAFRDAFHLTGDTVLSCLPGDAVLHRFLDFPFHNPRQLLRAAPFELENHIPLGIEELVIDAPVVCTVGEGVTTFTVGVPKPTLADHLGALAAAGLDPTAVGITPLAPLPLLSVAGEALDGVSALLDVGENRTSVVLLRDGVVSGLRTLSVGLSRTGGLAAFLQELRWTVLALAGSTSALPSRCFLSGGGASFPQLCDEVAAAFSVPVISFRQLTLPPVAADGQEGQGVFAACLGLALQEALGVATPVVNLRRGEFAPADRHNHLRREWRSVGWLSAGVAAAAGLALAVDVYSLNARYTDLRQEIRRLFAATLPEVQTVVNERAQLGDAVAALQARRRLVDGVTVSPLELLRQLSTALPEQARMDLDEWSFDEGAARFRGTTLSFEMAEAIKTAMAGLDLFREVQLKEVKTTAGGKKVSFELRVVLAPPAAGGERGRGEAPAS